ncbi:MAG TPA: hypothetical protein VFF73_21480 [Planctomycetota bacterium]|nr:hypothetical protein [Planctomycetota bacterium]
MTRARVLIGIGLGFFLFIVTGCMGPFVAHAIGRVLVGWTSYLTGTLPRVHVNPAAVGMAGVCLALVGAIGHTFLIWLRPSWRARWTFSALAIVVLAFVAGIAGVGVVHQTAWLMNAPEPLLRASWSMLSEFHARDSLSAIAQTETIFRERTGRYGTLPELVAAGLLDKELGSGRVPDYTIEVCPSLTEPELRWFAVAFSRRKNCRQFFVNETGLRRYSTGAPCPVDRATCEVPSGFTLVEK